MSFFAISLTVLGLCAFELITSLDNAIINGVILSTMSQRARRWFLFWGILIAVFLIRGLLPLVILWFTNPVLSIGEVFTASFNSDPAVAEAMDRSAPVLLTGGGIFLVLLFLHWLFLEPKHFGLRGERFITRHGIWFYAVASLLLAVVVWFSIHTDPAMAFSAAVGSTAFFLCHGFKENAERMEQDMLEGKTALSDLSKLLYLEVIDASFSIDGVLGAFAFTLSVPLILIGNGIGAFAVRELTIRNMENIKKYKYLKNGAMYSVCVLGIIMLLDAFGMHIPHWLSPVATFAVIGYFFGKSVLELRREQAAGSL